MMHRSVICFFLSIPIYMYPATVLDTAESFFSGASWVDNPSMSTRPADSGKTLPGGSETFAVMSPSSSGSSGGIYPALNGLGYLDYSGSPDGLVSLLRSVEQAFRNKTIPAEICADTRQFIPVLTNYRLNRFPVPASVAFGRPVPENSGDESSRFTSRFRLSFVKDQSISELFIDVVAVQDGGAWKIDELYFDGDSYAVFIGQN